jgi:hypothetical protein
MTAMTVTTVLLAAGLAALLWRRKGRHADQEFRPRAEVKNPIVKQAKNPKEEKHKGKTS